MENKDLVVSGEISIADDFLIQVAEQAERRVDAVMKIKRVSLKVTNARDWTDQNGNPYLQVSGSEKIANLFNISWRIDEPLYEEEPGGHFTWTYKGYFSLGGRTTEVIGTRSSKDAFFNKYEYVKVEGKKDERKLLPISAIDKGDVKKAALTNLLGNGITRILGIRNLTWEDLKEFANITKEQVTSIQYRKGGEPLQEPKKKNGEKPPETETFPSVTVGVSQVEIKTGTNKETKKPWIFYLIHAAGEKYSTYSESFMKLARRSIEEQLNAVISWSDTDKGKKIENLVLEEVPEPGSEANAQ